MAKLIALFLALAILAGTIVYDAHVTPEGKNRKLSDAAQKKEENPVPDFAFTTLDEQTLRIADIANEEILIHFWAGWCGVCFAEFPSLLKYVESRDGKTALIAIAIDDDEAPIHNFMERLAHTHDIDLKRENVYWVWDSDKSISLKTFNTIRVPETIRVNAERKMVQKIVGPVEYGLIPPSTHNKTE